MNCFTKLLTVVLGLTAFPAASHAQVFINEGFESFAPGTNSLNLGSGWSATTGAWTVDNTPGMAAGGSQYINAPSRIGVRRYVWFDANPAFLTRTPGNNVIVSSVKMFVPAGVVQSTFGGIFVFDFAGNPVAVIGIDMLTGQSLSDATGGVADVAAIAGAYNDLTLRTNFSTGTVEYLLNGTFVGFKTMSVGNLSAGFGDLDMYSNGDVSTASVPFRYDNYKVQAVAAPEAGTLPLIVTVALPLIGIVLRKRSRTQAG